MLTKKEVPQTIFNLYNKVDFKKYHYHRCNEFIIFYYL